MIFSIFSVNFEHFMHSYRLTGSNILAQTMWRVFDQPIGCLLFFVRCENFALSHNKRLLRADPCCRSVIKKFAHAYSWVYIELWMHLGSLGSIQKGRVALGCASSYSYAFFVLSKLPAHTHTLSMNKFLILPSQTQ